MNPLEAEFFFIPLYGECFLFRENQRAGKEALKITNKWFRRALEIVTHQYPHWNRTQVQQSTPNSSHFTPTSGSAGS
jgi:hypothetical protein